MELTPVDPDLIKITIYLPIDQERHENTDR